MCSVQVLMSTYNGEKYIRRQIDSILNQKDVAIHLLIRDDGSTDSTCEIIRSYAEKYSDQVEVTMGSNIGYKKSFLTLIQLAGDYDYYAFADQDDYWKPDKEIASIRKMEADDFNGAKLAQVNLEATDENLTPIIPAPSLPLFLILIHDQIYAGDFFQGCLMTWNLKAMKLLKAYIPKGGYSHDHWSGKVVFLLGKIYFIKDKKICYTRHGDNVSITGDINRARLQRLKTMFSGDKEVYDNIGADMLAGYSSLLPEHDRKMCMDLANYKQDFFAKMRLLLNPNLSRPSLVGTIFFKLSLFFNRV